MVEKSNQHTNNKEECLTVRVQAPLSFSLAKKRLKNITEDVLGSDYSLSLVVCDKNLSHKLNKTHRQKDKPTNILSFSLEENMGEIFICAPLVEEEASRFERTPLSFFEFLFIHGLFHLKGLDHGSKMEEEEQKMRLKYNV